MAANDRRYDSQSGAWTDGAATFLRCTLWRQAGENLANSLTRGMRVLVTGVLKQRSFQTREGDKRTVLELDVTEVGASLKWATVAVTKATRTTGSNRDDSAPAAAAAPPAEPPF